MILSFFFFPSSSFVANFIALHTTVGLYAYGLIEEYRVVSALVLFHDSFCLASFYFYILKYVSV